MKSFVYDEGGHFYRQIMILSLPDEIWITPKIAYFCSSGKSNNTLNYQGSWFPMGGILDKEESELTKGHIIKMSDLYKDTLPWVYPLLEKYFIEKDRIDLYTIISDLQNNKELDAAEITKYQNIYTEFNEIYLFIRNYFYEEWQLRVSLDIGNGYWSRNRQFADFIRKNIAKTNIVIDIPINTDKLSIFGIDESIEILKEEECQIMNIEEVKIRLKDTMDKKKTSDTNKDRRKILTMLSFPFLLDTYNRTAELLQKIKTTQTGKKRKRGGKRRTIKKRKKYSKHFRSKIR